jgi:FAD-linked sulfhydryl oxidase
MVGDGCSSWQRGTNSDKRFTCLVTMKTLFNVRISKTLVICALLIVALYTHLQSSTSKNVQSTDVRGKMEPLRESTAQLKGDVDIDTDVNVNVDTPFMPSMANETLKAELGNAAWRLFHTILARYPERPTPTQRNHLDSYIASFAQVYPCGDCARHFIKLLEKYPPQTGSRINAALWGCAIHNKVNERLGKPQYDCSTILEDYDCGCGADEQQDQEVEPKGSKGSKGQQKRAPTEPEAEAEAEAAKMDSRSHLASIKVVSLEDRVGG